MYVSIIDKVTLEKSRKSEEISSHMSRKASKAYLRGARTLP